MRSSWVLRPEPRGAQSATSGQGSAQGATRGSDARRLGLSGANRSPAAKERVCPSAVDIASLDQVGLDPDGITRCLPVSLPRGGVLPRYRGWWVAAHGDPKGRRPKLESKIRSVGEGQPRRILPAPAITPIL